MLRDEVASLLQLITSASGGGIVISERIRVIRDRGAVLSDSD
ncbi:MAG TPA: hypothetical protein VKB36_15845 [Vicinamibacterales bacterium]|nr:hypothetical protein [Vicinamibacterales bacterium]